MDAQASMVVVVHGESRQVIVPYTDGFNSEKVKRMMALACGPSPVPAHGACWIELRSEHDSRCLDVAYPRGNWRVLPRIGR